MTPFSKLFQVIFGFIILFMIVSYLLFVQFPFMLENNVLVTGRISIFDPLNTLIKVMVDSRGVIIIALLGLLVTRVTLIYLEDKTDKLASNVQRNESEIRDLTLKSIHKRLRFIESKINSVNLKENDVDKQNVVNEIINNALSSFPQMVLDEIEKNYSKPILLKMRYDETVKEVNLITDRLSFEVRNVTRRSNLNLSIGVGTSVVGGLALFWFAYYTSIASENINMLHVIANYIPKLSLIILIELFAYFFLRLYRTSLQEIKYYQNEITNIQTKLIAIRTALFIANDDMTSIKDVVSSIIKTERNFVLKSDETTVDIKTNQMELDTIARISAIFENIRSGKSKD